MRLCTTYALVFTLSDSLPRSVEKFGILSRLTLDFEAETIIAGSIKFHEQIGVTLG